MNNKIDLLLISPSNSKVTYQGLSKKYSAIELSTWANKFGVIAKENIINMTQIKLKRKLIEEQEDTQLKET